MGQRHDLVSRVCLEFCRHLRQGFSGHRHDRREERLKDHRGLVVVVAPEAQQRLQATRRWLDSVGGRSKAAVPWAVMLWGVWNGLPDFEV